MYKRLLIALILPLTLATQAPLAEETACPAFLDHEFRRLHSPEMINLCTLYKGKPIVIVNTASHCGYTKQFKGLEALYQTYKAQGVEVVGFPSDDFNQGGKSEAEDATVCYENYGVTFTMLAPSAVKGEKANPVFQHLNAQTQEPAWNFNKYLISADGQQVTHFDSKVKPLNSTLEKALKGAL